MKKNNYTIEVIKYTDIESLHTANSFTTGHGSKMSLRKAYAYKHSPIRTQRFYLYMRNIPLFCASQFVRSTQGVQWYQRSKRTDRGGNDFREECNDIATQVATLHPADIECDSERFTEAVENIKGLPDNYDRYAPTDLMADCNAEFIMNMSAKRLCASASKETREIWEHVIYELSKVDPDLAMFCVKPCIACGGICREPKCCGYNNSKQGLLGIWDYKKLFH